MIRVAILVDGAYFLHRYQRTYGYGHSAEEVAKDLFSMCLAHLDDETDVLYRIFYYDCPPFDKRAHNPVTGKAVDFSKTDLYTFRTSLFGELVKKRKLALRRGRLGATPRGWFIKPIPTKRLLAEEISVSDLRESDVQYELVQKGVDMRIGLDIASLAYKKQVERIVLVSGDSDFVPAAKLARREGIDFIIDPMWQRVSDDLFEHIDGMKTKCPKPESPKP